MKNNLAENTYTCEFCVFSELKQCKGGGICDRYLRVTPACYNCARLSLCKRSAREIVCKKWEPDYNQPFMALLKSLTVSDDVPPQIGLIDDRDFKKAPNWITFCMDHLGIRPFPRQIQIAMNFLSDYCPNPKCTNPEYLDLYDQGLGNILDNITFLEYGICPKCKATRLELSKKKKYRDFNYYTELVGVAGQRGSKSELAAFIAAYVWQWYTKLPDVPSRFFGLTGNKIHMTFCALTFGQAKTDLWDPFHTHITNSWWFTEYHKYLNEECQRLGIEPVIKLSETFMLYKHKNIQVTPVGPDKRILRGPTRFFTAIDELGWFSGGKKAIKLNPDEVYRPLQRSLKTIRVASKNMRIRSGLFDIPTAYGVNISSPTTSKDKIMRLLHDSERIKSMYGFHYATWEMNPELSRSDFDEEFLTDPIGSQRDYGAVPPLTDSPFISEPDVLLDSVRPAKKNILIYSLVSLKTKSGGSYVGAALDKIVNPKCPVVICLDAGYSRNAFGVTVLSYNSSSGKAVVEGALEVKPVDGKPVHFVYVYKNVIEPLLDNLAVAAVFIDRWQSITMQQTIDDRGDAPCYIYSLKPQDFEYIRSHILRGDVVYPRIEVKEWNDIIAGMQDYEEFFRGKPIAHLLLQTATVQSIGKKVCKSGDTDDDLFRASALGIYFCLEDSETQEALALLIDTKSTTLSLSRTPTFTMGVCRGFSQGSNRTLGKGLQTGIGGIRSFGGGAGGSYRKGSSRANMHSSFG
jgi:hypothetical protein